MKEEILNLVHELDVLLSKIGMVALMIGLLLKEVIVCFFSLKDLISRSHLDCRSDL